VQEPTEDGPFVVAFVVGVTPAKWVRAWGERMPGEPLELRPATAAEAIAGVRDGTVHVALVRTGADQPPAPDLSSIVLYDEQPVVVASKDSAVSAFDSLDVRDLANETVLDYAEETATETIELVATGVGVAIVPHAVARAASRKDVTAVPLAGLSGTSVRLTWSVGSASVDEFIGIVRGRTTNSSRATPAQPKLTASQKSAAKKARAASTDSVRRRKR
jgi:DNA-binding transcriptional LysR family regulator